MCRYIFKLQHSSVASVVAMFVLLTAVLANLSLVYTQTATTQNVYHAAHCLLFALLLVFLNTRLMQVLHFAPILLSSPFYTRGLTESGCMPLLFDNNCKSTSLNFSFLVLDTLNPQIYINDVFGVFT